LGPLQDIMNRESAERKEETDRKVAAEHRDPGMALEDLEVLAMLGSGTFGRVKLVKHKTTGQVYALKILQKEQIVAYKQQQNVMNERNVMMMVDHPFILKLTATFKDADCLYMLLELVQGGELFTLLANQPDGKLSSVSARFYAACVTSALECLHSKNVLYRDLKPENMLIDAEGYIKVVDMGFAKVVTTRTYTLCGTPEYLAPEIVLGKGHHKGVDYWAVGILIFEMLCGYSPFADHRNNDQMVICKNIVKAKLKFPKELKDKAAKDLITKLLEREPSARLGCLKGGAEDIRRHVWFTGLNWDALLAKRIRAPWKPPLKSDTDTSCFDPYDEDDDVEPYHDDGSNWDAEF
jgi:serine/threonine protein kinase